MDWCVLSWVIQFLLYFVGWKRFDLTAKHFVLYEIPEGLGRFIWKVWRGFLLENSINLLIFEQKLEMKHLGVHLLENCVRVNRMVKCAIDSVSKVLIYQAHPRIYHRSHWCFGKSEKQTCQVTVGLNRLACLLSPTYFNQIQNASLLYPM